MNPDASTRPPLDRERLSQFDRYIPDLSIEVVDEARSTNALVAERARAGADDGLVVVAEHQTAGRGRLDRQWESPAQASLTFSMLMRPTAPTRSWPWIPLLTGYAVDKALKARGYAVGLKWPNDVLIHDLKVAGILVERIDTPSGPAVVVGVGLNTHLAADELPVETATSLLLEQAADATPDRTTVLIEILAALRETYDMWQVGGDHSGVRLQESYAASCVTVGRQVRVDLPDGRQLVGTASAIDPTGQLVVDTESGREMVGAGDVIHVRSR